MLLTPSESDRVLLFAAAALATARLERGVRLNVPEATAVVASTVVEAARDGLSHADALAAGLAALGPDDVLPGVADLLDVVHVEAVFDDGSRLVSVASPIGGGSLGYAAPGAVLPGPLRDATGQHHDSVIDTASAVEVDVTNEADVAIAVSSHYHFFEVNPRLRFDREAAYGRHLALAAGAVVTFEPGRTRTIRLVPIRGRRVVTGFAGLVDGPLDAPGARENALAKARACGYADAG